MSFIGFIVFVAVIVAAVALYAHYFPEEANAVVEEVKKDIHDHTGPQ